VVAIVVVTDEVPAMEADLAALARLTLTALSRIAPGFPLNRAD
jgi:hypothetical protein